MAASNSDSFVPFSGADYEGSFDEDDEFPNKPRNDKTLRTTKEESDLATELRKEFHYMISSPTIVFAIKRGKVKELRTCVEQIVASCGITFDDEGFVNKDLLANHHHIGSTHNYEFPIVTWKRNKFHISKKRVYYGNCPACYTAGPLGLECGSPSCVRPQEPYQALFYGFPQEDLMPPYQLIGPDGIPFELLGGAGVADPKRLSVLAGKEPKYIFDQTQLEDNGLGIWCSYSTTPHELWTLMDPNDLVSFLNNNDRLEQVGILGKLRDATFGSFEDWERVASGHGAFDGMRPQLLAESAQMHQDLANSP